MIALVGSWFAGLGAKIAAIGAIVLAVGAAFFAAEEKGKSEQKQHDEVIVIKQEAHDRATVDKIEADVAKPGGPSASDQLHREFSRD